MPYGHAHRSTYRSTRVKRRTYRKKAVAVPKKPKTKSRYIRSNALQINKMHRQIKSLQMAKYGSVQRNFQTSALLTPFALRPIITDICNVACSRIGGGDGARFYQYDAGPVPSLQNIGGWAVSDNVFRSGENVDVPDTGKYLLKRVRLVMRFQGTPSARDTRIRVDLFSVRGGAIGQTVGNNAVFPGAVNQLNNLSNPEINKLGGNPYLKVWATKWLYLSSSRNMTGGPDAPGPAVTGNSGYLSFTIQPKGGKLRNQDITAPTVGQDPPGVGGGDWGVFNSPRTEPLWLCISSSDSNPVDGVTTFQASRTCTWADHVGKAGL